MFDFLRAWLARHRSSVSGAAGSISAVAQYLRFESELREDFFELAAQSGKPRGLRWISCDWLPEVLIVADQDDQLISAFATVNIRFEAVEGSEMEGVAAVTTIRHGSAVFHVQDGSWGSAGRVVFNMNPAEAARHLVPGAVTIFHREPDG